MTGYKFKQGQTTRIEYRGAVRWARVKDRYSLSNVGGPGGPGTAGGAAAMREYVVDIDGVGTITMAEEVLLKHRMAAVQRSVAWFATTRQGISEAIRRPRRGLRR